MKMKTWKQNMLRILMMTIVSVIIFLTGYSLFYKPEEVNSGIYTLATVIKSHHREVWVARFSPDGKFIASCSVDSSVIIYDRKGKVGKKLSHPAGVTSLDFSHDGNYIATVSYDGNVRIWNVADGTLHKIIKGSNSTVWCVAFSPGDTTIATAGEDKKINVWDVAGGGLKGSMAGHTLNIWSIKFTPDGSKLISGSFDKTIKIWNTSTFDLVTTLTGHTEAIVDIAVSHNGKILASASDDKTIRLWDINTQQTVATLRGGREHVQGLCFSADDRYLVSSGRDKPAIGEFLQNFFGDAAFNKGVSMRLWDMSSYKLIQTFTYHANDVNDVAFSPDGKWICAASSDNTVSLWHRDE